MNDLKMLDDILLDEEVKESLRAKCLDELAARRRPRLRWYMLPAAAAVLLLMTRLFFWPDPTPSYFVATLSLTPEQRITTPLAISSEVRVTTNPALAVARVKTTSPVLRLTDEEMLAMFSGVPCGLVGKKLLFFDPEDEVRFMMKLEG